MLVYYYLLCVSDFRCLVVFVWVWVVGFRVCCFRLNSVVYLVCVAVLFIICRCIFVVRLLAIAGCFCVRWLLLCLMVLLCLFAVRVAFVSCWLI